MTKKQHYEDMLWSSREAFRAMTLISIILLVILVYQSWRAEKAEGLLESYKYLHDKCADTNDKYKECIWHNCSGEPYLRPGWMRACQVDKVTTQATNCTDSPMVEYKDGKWV